MTVQVTLQNRQVKTRFEKVIATPIPDGFDIQVEELELGKQTLAMGDILLEYFSPGKCGIKIVQKDGLQAIYEAAYKRNGDRLRQVLMICIRQQEYFRDGNEYYKEFLKEKPHE
jgi:hypothetical protein